MSCAAVLGMAVACIVDRQFVTDKIGSTVAIRLVSGFIWCWNDSDKVTPTEIIVQQ